MFVVLVACQAKDGEEDAVIALHEDWLRRNGHETEVYLSWELLRKVDAPREFIMIAHFESQELARAAANGLEQDAWYPRLVSLLEVEPVCTNCVREWAAH